MWLMSQEQSLWPQGSPEICEGPPTGVPQVDVERETLAPAPCDSADTSFFVLPVAQEAAKETVTQEKTETIHDLALDTSALDKAEAKRQRSTEATEDLALEDLAPEDAELTVQPFHVSAKTDAPSDASIDANGASTELLNCVPNHLLREIVQQALQATHATGAAIALEQQGELICQAVAGDLASPEIGKMINIRLAFTRVCASSGTVQLCSNTALDSRMDADACRKLGVGAIIVVPLLHQDQFLGLIAVFSRRPYAFGMRDLQVLQDLAERFAANLQVIAESANAIKGRESPGALNVSPDN
jgi:putative methionine-R-sulfoxide reductase with GAF domain